MASPGRAPPAAAAASPSPSASACGGASASASIGSDVPVSFRELELQLPPGWCLRDCGGGGHCLYLCVAAMLFGVDEPGAGGEAAAAAAAAGPVQGPGFGAAASAAAAATASPGSYSWMLARWLRGVVSAFLVRDECVTAMLAAGLHGNLERAEAESDQQWLQRFKAFHLQAADGNAPPQDVDKEWGALAQRIQVTSRYATDLDILVLVYLFGLRLSCYVPYHANAQEFDGRMNAHPQGLGPNPLTVLQSRVDFPVPRLPSTVARAPVPPLRVANAVEHFKVAVRSDAQGRVAKFVDQRELQHTWSSCAPADADPNAPILSPFSPPDLAALKDWYKSQKSTAEENPSSTQSELDVLFYQVHQRRPRNQAELDDLRVSRQLYAQFTSRQHRINSVLQTSDPDDADTVAMEQEQPAASVPLADAYRQILHAADNKQQAERLEALLLAGPVEQLARLQMRDMSADDIASTCANAACILSVGENLHKRTSKVQTVGDVQSGKTASMEALTAKAIDNDYDLVLMLSGTNNVLRAQTQLRLESRFRREPVDKNTTPWIWLTNSRDITQTLSGTKYSAKWNIPYLETGESLRQHMERTKQNCNRDRAVLLGVIKKSVLPLRLVLNRVIRSLRLSHPAKCLIIDDESDDRTVFTCSDGNDDAEQHGNQISTALQEVLVKIIELRECSEAQLRNELTQQQRDEYDDNRTQDEDAQNDQDDDDEDTVHAGPTDDEGEDEEDQEEIDDDDSEKQTAQVARSTVLLARYTATPQANFLEHPNSPLCPDALWLLELARSNRSYLGLSSWFRNVPLRLLYPPQTRENDYNHLEESRRVLAEQVELARSRVQLIPYCDFHNYGPVQEKREINLHKNEVYSTVISNQVLPEQLDIKSTGLASYQADLLKYQQQGFNMANKIDHQFNVDVVPNRLPPSLLASLADFMLTGAVKRCRLDRPPQFLRTTQTLQSLTAELLAATLGGRSGVVLSQRVVQLLPRLQSMVAGVELRVDLKSLLHGVRSDGEDGWREAIRDVCEELDYEAQCATNGGNADLNGALCRLRWALCPARSRVKQEHAKPEPIQAPVRQAWVLDSRPPARSQRVVHDLLEARGVRATFYALASSKPAETTGHWDLVQVMDAGVNADNAWAKPPSDTGEEDAATADASSSSSSSAALHVRVLVHLHDGRECYVLLPSNLSDLANAPMFVSGDGGRERAENEYHAGLWHYASAQKVHAAASALLDEAFISLALRVRPWLRKRLQLDNPEDERAFRLLEDGERLPTPAQRARFMYPDASEFLKRMERIEAAGGQLKAGEQRKRDAVIAALAKVEKEVQELQHPDLPDQYWDPHWTDAGRELIRESRREAEAIMDLILDRQWQRLQLRMGLEAARARSDPSGGGPQIEPDLAKLVRWLCHISNRTVLRRVNTAKAGALWERKMLTFDYDNDYGSSPPVPRNLLLVGGNLLSRGLTIKGLCVSYYCRSQVQDAADLAIQAARWLGHRAAYERDLPTLYLQERQAILYCALTEHDRKLRRDIHDHILDRRNIQKSPILLFERMRFNLPVYRLTQKGRMRAAKTYGSGHAILMDDPSLDEHSAQENVKAINAFTHQLATMPHLLNDSCIGATQHNPQLLGAEVYRDVPLSVIQPMLRALHSQSRSPFAGLTQLRRLFQSNELAMYFGQQARINVVVLTDAQQRQLVAKRNAFAANAGEARVVWKCSRLLEEQCKDENARFISPALFDATAEVADDADPSMDESDSSAGAAAAANSAPVRGQEQLTGESRQWFRFPIKVEGGEEQNEDAPLQFDFTTPLGVLERQTGAPMLLIIHKLKSRALEYDLSSDSSPPPKPDADYLPCITCLHPTAFTTAQGLSVKDQSVLWTPIPATVNRRPRAKKAKSSASGAARLLANGVMPVNADISQHLDELRKAFGHVHRDDVVTEDEYDVWTEPFVQTSCPLRQGDGRVPLNSDLRAKLEGALQLVMLSNPCWDAERHCNPFLEPVLDDYMAGTSADTVDYRHRVLTSEDDRESYLSVLASHGSYPLSLFLIQQWLHQGSYESMWELERDLAVFIFNVRLFKTPSFNDGLFVAQKKGRLALWKLWRSVLDEFKLPCPDSKHMMDQAGKKKRRINRQQQAKQTRADSDMYGEEKEEEHKQPSLSHGSESSRGDSSAVASAAAPNVHRTPVKKGPGGASSSVTPASGRKAGESRLQAPSPARAERSPRLSPARAPGSRKRTRRGSPSANDESQLSEPDEALIEHTSDSDAHGASPGRRRSPAQRNQRAGSRSGSASKRAKKGSTKKK